MKNPAAQQLGSLGGKVKSAAKAKAARKNGKKGGRPKRKLTPAQAKAMVKVREAKREREL